MMRLLGIVGAVLASLSSDVAHAATCSCAGVPLLGSMEASSPGDGNWHLSSSYEYHDIGDLVRGSDEVSDQTGRERESRSLILEASYGINPKWSLAGLISAVEHDRRVGAFASSGRGLGDSILMVKYSPRSIGLTERLGLSLGIGARIPTGEDEERDVTVLAEDLQPSTGAWGTVLWAHAARSFSQEARTQLFGTLTYQDNQENDRDYRFGNAMTVAGGMSYQTLGKWGFAGQLKYRKSKRDERAGAQIPNTGGEWLYFEPSVQYGITDNAAAKLSGRIPIWRDLNDALQFTTSYSVAISFSYTFN